MPRKTKKGTKTMGEGGNGSTGPAVPVLGPQIGPPTVPVDQVYGMMRELELAHRAMDALGLPQGPLPDRLVAYAREWLRKVGEGSQTHIAIDARNIIKGVGASLYVPPTKGGNAESKGGNLDD